jgi:hypothetical protein
MEWESDVNQKLNGGEHVCPGRLWLKAAHFTLFCLIAPMVRANIAVVGMSRILNTIL